jgi:hypothetical protein
VLVKGDPGSSNDKWITAVRVASGVDWLPTLGVVLVSAGRVVGSTTTGRDGSWGSTGKSDLGTSIVTDATIKVQPIKRAKKTDTYPTKTKLAQMKIVRHFGSGPGPCREGL